MVAWRLRHILGNNGAPIQAYDQNVWAETYDYAQRDAKESLEFFQVLRARNLAMLKALPKLGGRRDVSATVPADDRFTFYDFGAEWTLL